MVSLSIASATAKFLTLYGQFTSNMSVSPRSHILPPTGSSDETESRINNKPTVMDIRLHDIFSFSTNLFLFAVSALVLNNHDLDMKLIGRAFHVICKKCSDGLAWFGHHRVRLGQ